MQTISLPYLNKINILEIELLKSLFGLKFDSKKQEFQISKSVSSASLVELYFALRNSIWNSINVSQVLEELAEEPTERARLHYFGPGYPNAIDGYIAKMGVLDYDILIEDPLCFPLSVKPTYEDHILRNPNVYLKHIYENSLFMIYLEDWVKKGYVYFVPSLPLIDINAFWELAKLSEILMSQYNLEGTSSFQKSLRFSIAEGSARTMLDFTRLMKSNYTINHIKRVFPNISDDEANKLLESMKSETLEQREKRVLEFALSKATDTPLSDKEKEAIISQFTKARPFNIERYLDVSQLTGTLMANAGMPLLHANYLADKLKCIPSTDHLGLMWGYEAWCEALSVGQGVDFEKVRSKVDLPFTFFDNIPLEFVEKMRDRGKAALTSQLLNEEWRKIRTSNDLQSYENHFREFNQVVKSGITGLKEEREQLLDELHRNVRKSGFASLGMFAGTISTGNVPLTVLATVSTLIASSIGTHSSFIKGKKQIESMPLSVFLEAEKISTKKS